MHEMSIAVGIIEVVTDSLPPDRAGCRVQAIQLEIGRLTAVVPESLRRCFEIASRDTPLSGARLDIEEVPIVAVCRSCHAESEQEDLPFVCGACRGTDLRVLCGRELLVASMELADP